MDMSDFFKQYSFVVGALKEYSFVVGALTGSLASYLLGLIVSHVRREKRWLGYSIDSRNIVSAERHDLAFAFKGSVPQDWIRTNAPPSHAVLKASLPRPLFDQEGAT
jgi:hypothetical protein